MRICCWNINSIDSIPHLSNLFEFLSSDIYCFQEVKSTRSKILQSHKALIPQYHSFYNFPSRKSNYSGVATFTKFKYTPVDALQESSNTDSLFHKFKNEFSSKEWTDLTSEGRILITDHGHFILVNVYFPNAHPDSSELNVRMEYKTKFHTLIERLCEYYMISQKRNMILVGDFNAVYDPNDHVDYAHSTMDGESCTQGQSETQDDFFKHPTRVWFQSFMSKFEWIDTFRWKHPHERHAYTCWNTYINARPINHGTRIDYILASPGLKPLLQDAFHLTNVFGSDHCPLVVEIQDEPSFTMLKEIDPPSLCTCYWKELKQSTLDSFLSSCFLTRTESQSSSHIIQGQESQEQEQGKEQSQSQIHRKKKQKSQSTLDFYLKPLVKEVPCEISFETIQQTNTAMDTNKVKSVWASIMTPKKRPNCHHGQECTEKTTIKPGKNQGRVFYTCARPGMVIKGSLDGRCDFFQWKNGSHLTGR